MSSAKVTFGSRSEGSEGHADRAQGKCQDPGMSGCWICWGHSKEPSVSTEK